MAGYVEGADRSQATLFPDRLDDFVGADNPVRVVDPSWRRSTLATSASPGQRRRRPAGQATTLRCS